MTRPLDRLAKEHRRFEALLRFLEGRIQEEAPDESNDYAELAELMAYLDSGLSGRHRVHEQIIWERLVAHSGSPRLVVQVLEELQRAVAEQGAALAAAVCAACDGASVSWETVKTLATGFVAGFRRQIALEERALFPLLIGTLRAEDWLAIEAAAGASATCAALPAGE